jgi:hypothetical protein
LIVIDATESSKARGSWIAGASVFRLGDVIVQLAVGIGSEVVSGRASRSVWICFGYAQVRVVHITMPRVFETLRNLSLGSAQQNILVS